MADRNVCCMAAWWLCDGRQVCDGRQECLHHGFDGRQECLHHEFDGRQECLPHEGEGASRQECLLHKVGRIDLRRRNCQKSVQAANSVPPPAQRQSQTTRSHETDSLLRDSSCLGRFDRLSEGRAIFARSNLEGDRGVACAGGCGGRHRRRSRTRAFGPVDIAERFGAAPKQPPFHKRIAFLDSVGREPSQPWRPPARRARKNEAAAGHAG